MLTWTKLLFFLCGALSPALCCDWLRHYRHLSNTTRSLLNVMGGQLTEEACPVYFPNKLYSNIRTAEVESQLVFIRDSLQLILDLYHHDNLSSSTWDADLTEHFLKSVERQLDGVNTCVSTHRAPDRGLRRYYRTLRRTLHRTGSGNASWELIRKETKRHLDQLELLVAFIRSRTPPV
ncbi:interferon a3-like [Antennarius striatus]|uniref:interferon a3-like n=1 Tax=Antennarius striatus TaxID=241820 RepID=UPI0035B40125